MSLVPLPQLRVEEPQQREDLTWKKERRKLKEVSKKIPS
jgi:hypothetical protein